VIAALDKSSRRLIFGTASGFLAMLIVTAACAHELRAATARIADCVDAFIFVCLLWRKGWRQSIDPQKVAFLRSVEN
jgi:hypothetical protein